MTNEPQTEREWTSLAADAAKLSDSKLLKIYGLLEQLSEKTELRPAFDALRPRLVTLRPPRRPSVSRLFFRPVEDLLDNQESYARKLNRISRSTLVPAWRVLEERLGDAHVEYIQTLIKSVPADDIRGQIDIAEPLWTRGSEELKKFAEECGRNLKLKVQHFGRDDDVLRQVQIIAEVTSVGAQIEQLKLDLPEKPIGVLAESHLERIRETVVQLGQEGGDRVRPLTLVLTARMRKPGDLLRLLSELKIAGGVAEKEQMTRELSGLVVGNLIRQTGDMGRQKQNGSQAIDLAMMAERLADGLSSVTETITGLRDNAMSQQVAGARTELGNFVVKHVVNALDQNLLDTLFKPPVSEEPDAHVREAQQMALALRRSARLAPHLGIQREVTAKMQDLRKHIQVQTEQMLKANLGPKGIAPDVERRMFDSLRMIEILAGSDEAERLYRDWKRQME